MPRCSPHPGRKLSETPALIRAASAMYGQNNRLIFLEMLNLSDEDLSPLYARRVIADEPPLDLHAPILPSRQPLPKRDSARLEVQVNIEISQERKA